MTTTDTTPDALETERRAVEMLRESRAKIDAELSKVIIGQKDVIEQLLISLLAGSHCLITGAPGLAKTLLVNSIAELFDLKFNRIQFTPDLMPADITGTEILEDDGDGRRKMSFVRGPVFANVLLADEINRTPPKTQAALLEAMQEHQVTAAGQRYKLDEPFFVLATQNPIEMEGTYPLPEAQVDRFMFSVKVQYPTIDEEMQIIKGTTTTVTAEANQVLNAEELIRLQDLIRGVPISDAVVRYAATISAATRPGESIESPLHKYISYGASPRASQYVVLGAKARAIVEGRYHVDFADIRAVAPDVYRHRLVLNFHARADDVDADKVISQLLQEVKEQ